MPGGQTRQISHLHVLQLLYMQLLGDSGSQDKVTLFHDACLWPDFTLV